MSWRGVAWHGMPLWCNIIFVQFTVLQKFYLQWLRWLENFIPTFVDGTSISRLLDHKPLAIRFLSLGDPFPFFIVIIFHFRFFYLFPLKSRRITHANTQTQARTLAHTLTHSLKKSVFLVSMRSHWSVRWLWIVWPKYQECRIKIVSGPIGCHLSLRKKNENSSVSVSVSECKIDFSITLLAESNFAEKFAYLIFQNIMIWLRFGWV